jgi:hypothetical protein
MKVSMKRAIACGDRGGPFEFFRSTAVMAAGKYK